MHDHVNQQYWRYADAGDVLDPAVAEEYLRRVAAGEVPSVSAGSTMREVQQYVEFVVRILVCRLLACRLLACLPLACLLA